MNTIVYLIRHSKKLDKTLINNELNDENYQTTREKIILSKEGERRAEVLCNNDELKNVDVIYSSNYTRAIQTAKYLAEKKGMPINIDSRFGERKHGIFKDKITLKEYYEDDYKNEEGESPKEVRDRMYEALIETIDKNRGKEIAIFSHAGALTILLTKWCKLEDVKEDKTKTLSLNGKVIFDKVFFAPELFKITLNEKNELVELKNIEIEF